MVGVVVLRDTRCIQVGFQLHTKLYVRLVTLCDIKKGLLDCVVLLHGKRQLYSADVVLNDLLELCGEHLIEWTFLGDLVLHFLLKLHLEVIYQIFGRVSLAWTGWRGAIF